MIRLSILWTPGPVQIHHLSSLTEEEAREQTEGSVPRQASAWLTLKMSRKEKQPLDEEGFRQRTQGEQTRASPAVPPALLGVSPEGQTHEIHEKEPRAQLEPQ